jgi:hypothetical protein
MSVKVTFDCDGCFAMAGGTASLRWGFRSLSGRDYGVGAVVATRTVEDVAPEGWVVHDPFTFACYCPTCWADIMADRPAPND